MEKKAKIIACFKELRFKFDKKNFTHRLIAQKIACLLDLKGIHLGYPWNIYVRGPYSPELTKDLFEHSDEFSQFVTEASLTEKESAIVKNLNDIFKLKPVLLEIGSTYGYFIKHSQCSPSEAIKLVKRLKPFYSESDIAIGISKAKEFLFEPTTEDLNELRRETEAWQRASLSSLRN